MNKVALLTFSGQPNLQDGEKLLPEAFKKIGIEAVGVPWDNERNWKEFSAIILRACWNYHLKREKFLRWLEERESEGIRILNPLNIIKWNTDKRYLKSLEKKGVTIIPTEVIEPENKQDLNSVLEKNAWEECIIKPVVGASAYGVTRFGRNKVSVMEENLDWGKPWIIQEFCPEINKEGEYSVIFFGRKYCHSVLKKPKNGDFRSQPEFGGVEEKVSPAPGIIFQASEVLDKVSGNLLYARVDGLVINGIFHLMELELTEPYLFFEFHPLAAKKFVEEYVDMVKS